MQFGMLSRVGLWNMYYMGVDDPMGRGTFGVSGLLKITAKHRIFDFGVAQKGSCAKKRADRS